MYGLFWGFAFTGLHRVDPSLPEVARLSLSVQPRRLPFIFQNSTGTCVNQATDTTVIPLGNKAKNVFKGPVMLNNKVIVYDDSCPMCKIYTYWFVAMGLIKPENRVGFATASLPKRSAW